MSIRSILLVFLLFAGTLTGQAVSALPPDLAEKTPHHPQVVAYLTEQYVAAGIMTAEEAKATVAYMTMRYERRESDLQTVSHMTPDARRAYMKAKRKERGNPLIEYATFTHIPLKRAAELMDLMHDTPKGQAYLAKSKTE